MNFILIIEAEIKLYKSNNITESRNTQLRYDQFVECRFIEIPQKIT